MMNSINSSEILSNVAQSDMALLAKINQIKAFRARNERIRYFKPSKPTDPNPNWPELGCNDQWAFIHSTATERWIFGGNRSGKTEVGVADAIMVATGTHPVRSEKYQPPVALRYVSTSWEDGVESIILPKFQELVKRDDLRGGSWEKAYSKGVLHFKNGSIVDFLTSEQAVNKHGGVKRHGIYLDEHHKKEYYDENKMRTVDYDGYIVGTMTPERGMTWEDSHVQYPAPGSSIEHWYFWIEKNPYLSKAGVAEVQAQLDRNPTLAAAKLHGEFVNLTGMVLSQYDRSIHIVDDFEIPSHWSRTFAIDPHHRKATAMVWGAWTPEGGLVIYRTIKAKQTVSELAQLIRAKSAGENIKLWLCDEAMGGDGTNIFGQKSVLEQLRAEGIRLLGTNQASDKTFEAGINRIRELMTPDPISKRPAFAILKSCDYMLEWIDGKPAGSLPWELSRYRYKNEHASDEETFREKVATVDDDYIDCVRYIAQARPNLGASTSDGFGVSLYGN